MQKRGTEREAKRDYKKEKIVSLVGWVIAIAIMAAVTGAYNFSDFGYSLFGF